MAHFCYFSPKLIVYQEPTLKAVIEVTQQSSQFFHKLWVYVRVIKNSKKNDTKREKNPTTKIGVFSNIFFLINQKRIKVQLCNYEPFCRKMFELSNEILQCKLCTLVCIVCYTEWLIKTAFEY